MCEIKLWAQMFFEDGSVSQGIRIPAEWLDDGLEWKIDEVAQKLLDSVNRTEGGLMVWGAGNMVFNYYPTSFSSSSGPSESNS